MTLAERKLQDALRAITDCRRNYRKWKAVEDGLADIFASATDRWWKVARKRRKALFRDRRSSCMNY